MSDPKMVSIKSIFKVNDNEDDNIIIEHDKYLLVLTRNENSADIYNSFDSQLNTYLNKITGKNKEITKLLLDKQLIYIGINPKKTTTGLASMGYHNNKLSYIILDSSILDIDTLDGTIGNIEETINAVYYQFIRFICLTNQDLKKNDILNSLIIKYYTYLIMKVLKLFSQTDKQSELIKYIVGIMYYRCFIKLNSNLASEKTLKIIDPKYIDEFQNTINLKLIDKYTDIKDILKILIDYKLTFETPNQLTYSLLMGLKPTSFLSSTISYEFLLSGIITSLYSQEFYKTLLINQSLQIQIEKIVSQEFNNAKFDTMKSSTLKSTEKVLSTK